MVAAFASALVGRTIFGNKRVNWGTYTASGGSTGGDINTGLRVCDFIKLQAKGAGVVADSPTVDEVLPIKGNAITIIVTLNTVGYWFAFGSGS